MWDFRCNDDVLLVTITLNTNYKYKRAAESYLIKRRASGEVLEFSGIFSWIDKRKVFIVKYYERKYTEL